MFIIAGIWLLGWGGMYYKATMFSAGQGATAITLLIVLFAYIYPTEQEEWVVWLSIFGCLFLGSFFGYVAMRYARIGVLFIGTWIGCLIGGLLYGMTVAVFGKGDNPMLLLWLTIIFSGIFVAILAFYLFDYIVIQGSSNIGSYLFIRGISVYFGGFPNELKLY